MPTYDGTQKANSGCAQNIPYHIFRTSYVDNLRQDALAMASSEAIAFCDVDNFSGPEIECDASTLTEDEWQKRRAHTIGGSDCAAIFGENKYKGYIHLSNQPVYQRPSKNSGGPKYGFTGETRIIPGTTRTAYRIVSKVDFSSFAHCVIFFFRSFCTLAISVCSTFLSFLLRQVVETQFQKDAAPGILHAYPCIVFRSFGRG